MIHELKEGEKPEDVFPMLVRRFRHVEYRELIDAGFKRPIFYCYLVREIGK